MHWFAVVVLLVGCGKAEPSKSDKPVEKPSADKADTPSADKPVDNMDEKMRHCPLAIDGAASTLTDIEGGVQFEVKVPAAGVAEVQRRAHHVIEFAAKRHDKSTHQVSDKQGGGTMRNCPVVTSETTISVDDLSDGARITVTVPADRVAELRAESRRRVDKFAFVGATIDVK